MVRLRSPDVPPGLGVCSLFELLRRRPQTTTLGFQVIRQRGAAEAVTLSFYDSNGDCGNGVVRQHRLS